MTGTRTAERTDTRLDSGHGSIAHIARKSDIAESYVLGTPLVALCGYTWVPSKSPKGLPVCAACKEIASMTMGEEADRIGF